MDDYMTKKFPDPAGVVQGIQVHSEFVSPGFVQQYAGAISPPGLNADWYFNKKYWGGPFANILHDSFKDLVSYADFSQAKKNN